MSSTGFYTPWTRLGLDARAINVTDFDCGDMVDDCELIVANVVDEICNAIVYTCSPLKVLVPEDLDLVEHTIVGDGDCCPRGFLVGV